MSDTRLMEYIGDFISSYSYFGARYYDPNISIWLSVDPLSDKYPGFSAYVYTANNPIMLIDPNGMEVDEPESHPDKTPESSNNSVYNDFDNSICPTCPKDPKYDVFRDSEFEFDYNSDNESITRKSTEKIDIDKVKDPMLEVAAFLAEVAEGNYLGDEMSDHFVDKSDSWGNMSRTYKEDDVTTELTVSFQPNRKISRSFKPFSKLYYVDRKGQSIGLIKLTLLSRHMDNEVSSNGTTQWPLITVRFSPYGNSSQKSLNSLIRKISRR